MRAGRSFGLKYRPTLVGPRGGESHTAVPSDQEGWGLTGTLWGGLCAGRRGRCAGGRQNSGVFSVTDTSGWGWWREGVPPPPGPSPWSVLHLSSSWTPGLGQAELESSQKLSEPFLCSGGIRSLGRGAGDAQSHCGCCRLCWARALIWTGLKKMGVPCLVAGAPGYTSSRVTSSRVCKVGKEAREVAGAAETLLATSGASFQRQDEVFRLSARCRLDTKVITAAVT